MKGAPSAARLLNFACETWAWGRKIAAHQV